MVWIEKVEYKKQDKLQSSFRNRKSVIIENMGCCKSHLLNQLQPVEATYLQQNPAEPTPQQDSLTHIVLSKLHQVSRMHKKVRNQRFSTLNSSNIDHEAYFKVIQTDLEAEATQASRIFERVKQQNGGRMPSIEVESILEDIRSYIHQERITKQHVRDWIKSKIDILTANGKDISKALEKVSCNKDKVSMLLQVIIDDQTSSQKDFLLSVAYDFIWIDELQEETKQWQDSLQEFYNNLGQLLI